MRAPKGTTSDNSPYSNYKVGKFSEINQLHKYSLKSPPGQVILILEAYLKISKLRRLQSQVETDKKTGFVNIMSPLCSDWPTFFETLNKNILKRPTSNFHKGGACNL